MALCGCVFHMAAHLQAHRCDNLVASFFLCLHDVFYDHGKTEAQTSGTLRLAYHAKAFAWGWRAASRHIKAAAAP
eukprot:6311643-Amphidinium_carterae.1